MPEGDRDLEEGVVGGRGGGSWSRKERRADNERSGDMRTEKEWSGDKERSEDKKRSGVKERSEDMEWSGDMRADKECLRASSVEVIIYLSMDRVGLGLLRLSSLYNLPSSVDAFCARARQAGRVDLRDEDCDFIRAEVLAAALRWPRWRWHAVVDQATLQALTAELGERLARFQAEGLATIRYHAAVH
jgi:hypothetical protein